VNADNIGLQLYTVRDLTAQDMLGTLERLAAIGYRAVEFAGYGNASVRDIRATLDQHGMTAVGAHVALDNFESRFDQTIDDLQTLGCRYAIVPWVAEDRRGSLSNAQRLADQLNRLGEQVRAAGLQFAYHNHAFEFDPIDGSSLWDVLLRESDPELVALELDVFWAEYAGFDPVEMIGRLTGRVPLLHAKDISRDDPKADAPIGDGTLPWPRMLEAAEAAGVEWLIVEQDRPRDALRDVERSLANLQAMMRR
jgi:sugar phosphate isomerase/epimerase